MNKALYEKLFSEQEKYRAWLLEQTPAEILNHAYEYTVREDIILTLEYHDVDDDQSRVLLAQENLLGELFDAFEHRETNYMDVVSGTVYDLANTLLSEEEREKNKLRNLPIYYHSGEYARENGELDKYRESRAANIGCRDAIQEAIKNHYHDNRLDPAAVSEVMDKYNFHRVLYVLANTVRQKDWDGRFSQSNKYWAATMYIPEDRDSFNGDRNTAFCVEAHPTLVNGYIDMARDQFVLTQPLTGKDIQAEAERINAFFEKNGEPNSPNKTHIMIEISPKFLQRAGRYSHIIMENKFFDVQRYAVQFMETLDLRDKKPSLESLADCLGVENPRAHRALPDAVTTAKIFLKLREMDSGPAEVGLGDLLSDLEEW